MKKPASDFICHSAMVKKVKTFFDLIKGEYHHEETVIENDKPHTSEPAKKIWDREPEPPTLTGLAFFLGFNSMEAFEDYERNGRFAPVLKRGRLRIEAWYEKKLHQQSPAGAVFALKNMGWNEKREDRTIGQHDFKSIKIEIIDAGPNLAGNEKEVTL
jgi:hypothetical protein